MEAVMSSHCKCVVRRAKNLILACTNRQAMSKEHGSPCESISGAGSHSFSVDVIREETIKKSNKKLLKGWEKCLQMRG